MQMLEATQWQSREEIAALQHRKLAVLARHCEEAGRPYGEIEKTISTRLAPGEPAESFARRCAAFAGWGSDHAGGIAAGPWAVAGVETLGRTAALIA